MSERYVHLPGFTSRTLTSLFWWGNTIPNAPELYSAPFELPLPDVCYTTNQLLRTLALWTKISIYDVSDNSEKTLFPTYVLPVPRNTGTARGGVYRKEDKSTDFWSIPRTLCFWRIGPCCKRPYNVKLQLILGNENARQNLRCRGTRLFHGC